MTDLHRSSVLPEVQVEATLPRFSLARLLRAFLAVPALEASFLLSLLSFVALAGILLFILTPVPLPAIGLGISAYAFLPMVSGSIVWVLVTGVERFLRIDENAVHARLPWMLGTAMATSLAIPVYGMFKQYILKDKGFPFDPALAAVDRFLFAGQDPWVIFHDLFGSVWFTIMVDRAYTIWAVILMACPVVWAAMVKDPVVRARLISCWIGVWLLIGGVAAWLLASAGPMYYPHLVGPDQSFSMLHDRIVELGRLAEVAGSKLATPTGHVALLNRYMQGNYVPGFGISAMPSVHVAMATLFAIGGFVLHRWIGWLMTAYAVLIWIGSVYLGWHYATDGIVGAAMTIGMWKLSGKLAEPFEDRLRLS